MASVSSRSGETFLSDDELLLFDSMAVGKIPLWALCRDKYQLSSGSRETHGLDDGALLQLLERCVKQGLVRAEESQLDIRRGLQRFYTLSPDGGALWELERRPTWEAYCVDIYDENTIDVACLSREIGEAFVAAGKRSGLLDPSVELVETIRRQPAMRDKVPLVLWKSFAIGYELKLRATDDRQSQVDWSMYHAGRTWWRTVEELITLQRD